MTTSDPLQRAKRPRVVLAGPYGHPFHPIAVTIPIGTWIASVIFDLIGFFVDDHTPYALGAQVLIAIGVVGALLAAILGFLDFSVIPARTPAHRTALLHMTLNLAVTALFVVNFFIRAGADHTMVSGTGFVLSIVGLIFLGVSGWLGGKLAYRFGVRVAAEDTQREGFVR
jgi:uncharacterized membrane protein